MSGLMRRGGRRGLQRRQERSLPRCRRLAWQHALLQSRWMVRTFQTCSCSLRLSEALCAMMTCSRAAIGQASLRRYYTATQKGMQRCCPSCAATKRSTHNSARLLQMSYAKYGTMLLYNAMPRLGCAVGSLRFFSTDSSLCNWAHDHHNQYGAMANVLSKVLYGLQRMATSFIPCSCKSQELDLQLHMTKTSVICHLATRTSPKKPAAALSCHQCQHLLAVPIPPTSAAHHTSAQQTTRCKQMHTQSIPSTF